MHVHVRVVSSKDILDQYPFIVRKVRVQYLTLTANLPQICFSSEMKSIEFKKEVSLLLHSSVHVMMEKTKSRSWFALASFL